jgi:hypothetical protein
MGYELMGRAHAAWLALGRERGQGTVEYVGLILLIAVVMAGVVKASGGFSDDKSNRQGGDRQASGTPSPTWGGK